MTVKKSQNALTALLIPEDERPVHFRITFMSTTDTGAGEEAKQRTLY